MDIDVDMHIDSDMAVSRNWGSVKKGVWGSFKRVLGLIYEVGLGFGIWLPLSI